MQFWVSGSGGLSGPVKAGTRLSPPNISGLRVCDLGGGEFARFQVSFAAGTRERGRVSGRQRDFDRFVRTEMRLE